MNSSLKENYIIELFKRVLPYKWSIIFISIIFMILAKVYLYFIPSVYESYAIIKVKINENKVDSQDLLRDSLFKTNTVGINQEMAILQTYQINQKALEKVDFRVQYFKEEKYRKIEIYKNVPFEIKNIKNLDSKVINKLIKITPFKEGFSIYIKDHNDTGIYAYDEQVETAYFSATIYKEESFTHPLYIKLHGSKRHIYESIVKSSLSVSQLKLETNLIKVAFKDTIPERANRYLDALVDVYINRSIKKKDSINSKILAFLDERLAITKEKLDVAENELQKYQSENQSVDPSIKSKDSFARLSDIDLQLSELKLKEQLVNNLLVFMKHNRNLDSIAPTLLEFNAQSTLKLINDIQALQLKEDDLLVEFTDKYPPLMRLRKRIRSMKKQIRLNIKNLHSTVVFKRKRLVKEKQKYEQLLTILPKKEKNLIHFKRNYEVNSKTYNYLLEKKSENELVQVATRSDYEAVDKAYNSMVPIKPKRLAVVILFAILGFGLGVLLALIHSFSKKKIEQQKDIEMVTRLPFYGRIPLYKKHIRETSAIEDAYRQLAINLQFSKKENEGNIVLFTSPSRGEGKTSTLSNLMSIFKQTKYKSILIDLDMKQPTLHQYFNMDLQYSGMSTFLSKRDNLGNIIFTTNFPNLDIITAGPIPPNPAELLLSPYIEGLFQILKERYDYVFIDACSFTDIPEIINVMKFTDKNLLVLRENITQKEDLAHFETEIKRMGLSNIGLVFKSTIKGSKKKQSISTPILTQGQPSIVTKPKELKG